MPASENISMPARRPWAGWSSRGPRARRCPRPGRRCAHRQDAGEGAEGHEQIDRQIDEHGLRARLGVGGDADQRIADVADGGVGHQPLDVGLPDGREGAEQHRGDGEEDDDLLPLRPDAGKGREHHADSSAMAAILGAAAKKAVTGVGAPS